jgi:hypothetical protein
MTEQLPMAFPLRQVIDSMSEKFATGVDFARANAGTALQYTCIPSFHLKGHHDPILRRRRVPQGRPGRIPAAGRRRHQCQPRAAGQARRLPAIYLSGGGVAAGSLGLPDLGISNLDDVLTDVRRITDVCDLPLLVDVDTGFGASAFNVARTVKSHDQVRRRRHAHRRPGRRQALRPPSGQGNRQQGRKWSTASRPPSMRAPTRTSSSWRAPTRWPWKAWTPPSSAPSPASKPAPT